MIRLETTIQDASLQPEGTGKVSEEMKPLRDTSYATFGPFKNTSFQILFRNGKLALDVPTELVNELDAPDKDGRWKIVNTVSFRKDSERNITAMLMHRGNNTHELPRAKPADAETPKK